MSPGLLIPLYDLDGNRALFQFRPDKPRKGKGGKPCKYEIPAGRSLIIDVPPSARDRVSDAAVPLWVTEGARKADAAVGRGLCCVSLIGVCSWKDVHFWDRVPLTGREVVIAFDSDVVTNPSVRRAAEALAEFLASRGAKVRSISPRPGRAGEKVGLDDHLAKGGRVEDLEPVPPATATGTAVSYLVEGGQTLKELRSDDGTIRRKPLANFEARLVADHLLTDGVEEQRWFEVEATVGGAVTKVRVRAEEFDGMRWVPKLLGASAIIEAGAGVKDELRAAIQKLSVGVRQHRGYGHLGWVPCNGAHVFLHAGGVIGGDTNVALPARPQPSSLRGNELPGAGANGAILARAPQPASVRAEVSGPLVRFDLPPVPSDDGLVRAVQASLAMIGMAPDPFLLPLYAAIWRAPLGPADYSLFLVGPTGSQKTETAALAQQHFGPAMDGRNLPGSWQSTANFNGAIAFLAKDCLLVVDDWVLRGSPSDMERAGRDADRLFRGQGNGAGRGRCAYDGSARPDRPPRCLLVSTGEAVPDGQSLAARLLILEVRPGDVKLPHLTRCQHDAKQGLYAQAMAGYLTWVAPQLEHLRLRHRQRRDELRDEAVGAWPHARMATTFADLLAGFETFLEFAAEVGAIADADFDQRFYQLRDALVATMKRQERELKAQDPAKEFMSILGELITSGNAHLCGLNGGPPPDDPERWGWGKARKKRNPDSTPLPPSESESAQADKPQEGDQDEVTLWPKGKMVGWVSGDYVLLLPSVSLTAVQSHLGHQRRTLPLTERTLGRELDRNGLLADKEEARGRFTVRRNVHQGRLELYLVRADDVVRPGFNGPPWQERGWDGPEPADVLSQLIA